MDFNSLDDIKRNGFVGFRTMQELFADSSPLPSTKGIYLILKIDSKEPTYLDIGTGGHFKGKNPNVSLQELEKNWIDKTIVIYIGKAGGESSKATLKSRLKQYFGFGQGRSVGHWGGRLIWQLEGSNNLVVCWKALPNADPRSEEGHLIKTFVSQFSNRPFANLKD